MTAAELMAEAIALHQAGHLSEAERRYRAVLAQVPQHSGALQLLGVIAHQLGRHELATELIRQAIALRGDVAEYHNNLGMALQKLQQGPEAIAAFQTAIALNPTYAVAHNNLGNALTDAGRLAEAQRCYETALALSPTYAEAHSNLADLCRKLGRSDEAVAGYLTALRFQPALAVVHSHLGGAYLERGDLDEAIACFRRAVELAPRSPEFYSNLLLALHYHPESSPATLGAEMRHWADIQTASLAPAIAPRPRHSDHGRRLRIGYVSPDFCNHPISRFIAPLLRHHDRRRFEIFCYANVERADATTARLQAMAENWRDISLLGDTDAAQLIRDEQIDILIDLAAHSGRNRLLLFARKPAPVQVTYLAYCSTTGLKTIDYRLTDRYLDPSDSDFSHYTEKSIRLSGGYWCYEAPVDLPVETTRRAGGPTFGCLNNFAKVAAPTRAAWARLLGAVPAAKLILHAAPGSHREKLLGEFAAAGVHPHRVQFVEKQPIERYLDTYRDIDVALDPFPFCGGTTTCDALWMGIPVVSLAGRTAVSRSGLNLLSHVGLSELVAFSEDDYVRIAAALIRDRERLQSLRANLRVRMQSSPLMNAHAFVSSFEAALDSIWREQSRG